MKNQAVIFLFINAILSALVFLFCGIDKLLSKRSARRIPEKYFLFLSVFGGGIGLCLGMLAFHHKTNHWYFRVTAVLSTVFWIASITFMLLKTSMII